MRWNSLAMRDGFVALALFVIGCASIAVGQSVTLTPTTLAFGNQVVNTASASRPVTLKNGLSTPLTISGISTSLADYSYTSTCPVNPATLRAGASCLIHVTFSPAQLGARKATLTVTDNAPNGSQTSTLNGSGVAPVSLTPATIRYAAQAVGTASAPVTVMLTNNQAKALTITSIASSLADFPESNNCPLSPSTLGAGANCTVSVSFVPVKTGNRIATLTIKDNASNSPQTVALSGQGINVISLVSIAVTPNPASIPLGTSQQFTATGTYSNGSTQNLTSTATWASSAPVVANIASGGLAASSSQGSTTITASSGTISGSSVLSVTPPALVSIAVLPGNPVMAAGTIQQLKTLGTYGDGSVRDVTAAVTWTSNNPATARVGATGLLNAIAIGSSNVTADLGTVAGSASVTVSTAVLTSIALTPALPVTQAGLTVNFAATGTFSDGSTQDVTGTAQWNSDTSAVATVGNQSGSQGVATAVGQGLANISATSGTVSAAVALNVAGASLNSITVTPAAPSIAAGTIQQFTATGNFSDGSTQNLTSMVTWSSTSPATANINAAGLATAGTTGATTVTATLGSVSGTAALNVTTATLVSIAISPTTAFIPAGSTQAFTAKGTFSDGSTQDLTQVGYWNSSAATSATVSDVAGTQGVANGLSAGTAQIHVASNGVMASASLTVDSSSLVSIAVNPASASIALGATQQFTATGTYNDGSQHDLTALAMWSSSNNGAAIVGNGVGSAGFAVSSGNGAAAITAAFGGMTGAGQLSVGQPSLVSIAVTPANATIASGTTRQYAAIGTFSDGSTQNLTASATWSSTAPSVVNIAPGGLASALTVGGATITATSGSISGSTGITVSAPLLLSISVTPGSTSIPVLSSQQYAATGTYSDGSMQTLTNNVTWSSSSANVATISTVGLVSSMQSGTATISATLGSVMGTSSLSVGIGSVTPQKTVGCAAGFATGAVCTQAVVSCPNVTDLTFTYGVTPGTGAGTILIFNGAAGVLAGGKNYIASWQAAGFSGIQVTWSTDWQDTGYANKNILTAACRIAAVGNYLYSTYYTGGGFGVLGGSAGAGAVGYWLGWYGGSNLLDNVEVASGPVYADIEQGCEVPEVGSVTIIPTDGTPWSDTVNFRQGQQNGLSTETGYTCQPPKGTTSGTTDAAWLAQSIVQPGWANAYTQTSVAGWVCNNSLNNSEAEAWLFFEGLTTPYAFTAISQCPDSETVDNGYTPQGVLGSTAITNDMIANTYDKHNR